MSYIIEKTKEKIKELEELLENPETSSYQKEHLPKSIQSYKNKLEILEANAEGLDKVKDDMKAILSHTHAIDEKYECRSVKFMFRVADFVEKYISFALGKKIAEYTVKNIHAPVCSIVAGSKPDLPPMPKHGTKEEFARLERIKREREELLKWRSISVDYLEKPPTWREKISIKYNKFVRHLLPQQEN